MKRNPDKLYGIQPPGEGYINVTCTVQNCKSTPVQMLNGAYLCPTHYCNLAPETHAQEMRSYNLKVEKMKDFYEKALIDQRTEDKKKHQQAFDNYSSISTQLISLPLVRFAIKITTWHAIIKQKITLFCRSILAKVTMPSDKEILELIDKAEKKPMY